MKPRYRLTVRLKTPALWARLETLGRSQNWLARRVGISPGYLSTLLNRERAPSGRVRRRIQRALDVHDFDELFELQSDDNDN